MAVSPLPAMTTQLDEFLEDDLIVHQKVRARWAVNLLMEVNEVEKRNIDVSRVPGTTAA